MIPILLVAGFAAGYSLSRFVSVRVVGLVGVAVAVAWGIGVGWNDQSMVTGLGGFILAAGNYTIGAFVGHLGGRTRTARSDEVKRQRGA